MELFEFVRFTHVLMWQVLLLSVLKAEVGRIEKKVDLAWNFERVQLPGPSPSLFTVLQLAKTPLRSSAQSNSFFLACFFSLVFFCLLVYLS